MKRHDKDTLRRVARDFDLYYSDKVHKVNDNTFWVASQYDSKRHYQVILKQGAIKPYCYCTCPDWMKHSGALSVPDIDFWCKHAIAAKIVWHQNGNRQQILNECGSNEAKRLQDQPDTEFSWQRAYDKCAKLIGGKAQVDIIINDLVNWGKLRQENSSHYNRKEWLVIFNACQRESLSQYKGLF